MTTTWAPRAAILWAAMLLGAVLVAPAAAGESESTSGTASTPAAKSQSRHMAVAAAKADKRMVRVFVYDRKGKLVGPLDSPKVILTAGQWRARLTTEQYKVLRSKTTEQAFCGDLVDNKKDGVYSCAGCSLPLFASGAKFDSGTGWPSFMQPVAKENIETHRDLTGGEIRTEIHCVRCKGHLGHVFDDGPAPTGLRFCLNSASLNFTPKDELAKLADPATGMANDEPGDNGPPGTSGPKKNAKPPATAPSRSATSQVKEAAPAEASEVTRASATEVALSSAKKPATTETAVFAGGCFWCTEAVFEQLKGVRDVESGYCGGTPSTANYERVHQGTTKHAEAIRVSYDPAIISYAQLLDVFFDAHDPTQRNRQGEDDVGRQYRSAIFYATSAQKEQAESKIKQLQDKKVFAHRIVTRLEPLATFYPAEDLHQDFVHKFPFEPYVQDHAVPKVCDVRIKHPELLKDAE